MKDPVILFFPNTYSVRLFEDESLIKSHYPGNSASLRHNRFRGPKDLAVVFSQREMLLHLRELTTPRETPSYDARDRARESLHREDGDASVALWEALVQVADRVQKEARASAEPQEKYEFKLDALVPDTVAKFPKQARIILDAVRMRQIAAATEKELSKMMVELAASGQLKTKQDPWRIMQFYQASFHSAGLMTYPGRRERREEEPESAE